MMFWLYNSMNPNFDDAFVKLLSTHWQSNNNFLCPHTHALLTATPFRSIVMPKLLDNKLINSIQSTIKSTSTSFNHKSNE